MAEGMSTHRKDRIRDDQPDQGAVSLRLHPEPQDPKELELRRSQERQKGARVNNIVTNCRPIFEKWVISCLSCMARLLNEL